jgi:hypothetical protein
MSDRRQGSEEVSIREVDIWEDIREEALAESYAHLAWEMGIVATPGVYREPWKLSRLREQLRYAHARVRTNGLSDRRGTR